MALSTAVDLVEFFDIRDVKELANDIGDDVSDKMVLESDNPVGSKVANALATASGYIQAALRQSNQYQVSDIALLTGDALAYYKQMECLVAMSVLFRRKPYVNQDIATGIHEQAEGFLEKLRKGINVLGIDVNINAGVASAVHMPEPQVFSLQSKTIATKLTGKTFPYRN